MAAQHQTSQSEQHEPAGFPVAHVLQLHHFHVLRHAFARQIERVAEENHEADKQNGSVPARHFAVDTHQQQCQRGNNRERHVLADGVLADGHRRHHGRDAHDGQRVEGVRAQHITHGNVARTLDGRHQRDEELGHRRAHGHDGQANHNLRNAQSLRQCRRSVGQSVGAPQHQHGSYQNEKYAHTACKVTHKCANGKTKSTFSFRFQAQTQFPGASCAAGFVNKKYQKKQYRFFFILESRLYLKR